MKLFYTSSPHIRSQRDTKVIMRDVVIALLPSLFVGLYYFGIRAGLLVLLCVLSAVLSEYLMQRFLFKRASSIGDFSAIITGLLLAYNLPSSLPLWMAIIGSFMAIAIGKMSFGGLGQNPFNPALVGRVFLLVCFPVAMTSWPVPQSVDGVTGATVLSLFKEGVKQGHVVNEIIAKLPSLGDLFLGHRGGSLGEVSTWALLLGGIFLLVRKVITWHIPVSFLLSSFVFASIFYLIDPTRFLLPSYHLMAGGIILGAWFMATDMATSPMSPRGMLIFGFGCGLLTIVIRSLGAYPEGVSFAILIMNAFTPLINKYVKPVRYGE